MEGEGGGFYIPDDVVERRYIRGIINLFDLYLPEVDDAMIFDNSDGKPELLAKKTNDGKFTIMNVLKLNKLKQHYDKR